MGKTMNDNLSNFEIELSNANYLFETIIKGLTTEGYLTKEDENYILKNYSVIVESKSWLPEFLQKFLKIEDKEWYRIVKAIDRRESD